MRTGLKARQTESRPNRLSLILRPQRIMVSCGSFKSNSQQWPQTPTLIPKATARYKQDESNINEALHSCLHTQFKKNYVLKAFSKFPTFTYDCEHCGSQATKNDCISSHHVFLSSSHSNQNPNSRCLVGVLFQKIRHPVDRYTVYFHLTSACCIPSF